MPVSDIGASYSVEQVGERWACVAGNIALLCDTEDQAKAMRERLVASAIRQRQLDRERGFIQ